jgi:predicted RNase H-like HicB family nuclease
VRGIDRPCKAQFGLSLKVSSEGCYLATCAGIPGLVAHGRALTQALAQSFELPVVFSA